MNLDALARRWWPIRESLEHLGLIGFDPADLVTVMTPALSEELHVVPYEPALGDWSVPEAIAPSLKAAERMVVVIRCCQATTLFDLNAICQAIGSTVSPDIPILVAAPVAEGAPVVAMIAMRR